MDPKISMEKIQIYKPGKHGNGQGYVAHSFKNDRGHACLSMKDQKGNDENDQIDQNISEAANGEKGVWGVGWHSINLR